MKLENKTMLGWLKNQPDEEKEYDVSDGDT